MFYFRIKYFVKPVLEFKTVDLVSKRENSKRLKTDLACTHVRAHHAQAGAILEVLLQIAETEKTSRKCGFAVDSVVSVRTVKISVFAENLRTAKLRAHK